jgi:uncharacterized protein
LHWIEGTTKRFEDGKWFDRNPVKVLAFLDHYMG